MKENNNCRILLVEDNPGDILLLKETILENNSLLQLKVITNGEDAINYLFNSINDDRETIPDFIILDLNLPKKSGKEVLEHINKNEKLKAIPVIILTSADIDDDVFTNGRYNIKYYLLKPIELDEYLNVICFIRNYITSCIKDSPEDKD